MFRRGGLASPVEAVVVAAGEAKLPRRNIPRANSIELKCQLDA